MGGHQPVQRHHRWPASSGRVIAAIAGFIRLGRASRGPARRPDDVRLLRHGDRRGTCSRPAPSLGLCCPTPDCWSGRRLVDRSRHTGHLRRPACQRDVCRGQRCHRAQASRHAHLVAADRRRHVGRRQPVFCLARTAGCHRGQLVQLSDPDHRRRATGNVATAQAASLGITAADADRCHAGPQRDHHTVRPQARWRRFWPQPRGACRLAGMLRHRPANRARTRAESLHGHLFARRLHLAARGRSELDDLRQRLPHPRRRFAWAGPGVHRQHGDGPRAGHPSGGGRHQAAL